MKREGESEKSEKKNGRKEVGEKKERLIVAIVLSGLISKKGLLSTGQERAGFVKMQS